MNEDFADETQEIIHKLKLARFQELWRHFLDGVALPRAEGENYFERKTVAAMREADVQGRGIPLSPRVLAVGFARAIIESAQAKAGDKKAVMKFLRRRRRQT